MKANTSTTGIGFTGLLTLLFIALKLTGQIDWSWVWVLSPFWIPFVITLFVLLVIGVLASVEKVRGYYE